MFLKTDKNIQSKTLTVEQGTCKEKEKEKEKGKDCIPCNVELEKNKTTP
jgi:hypothetical protein